MVHPPRFGICLATIFYRGMSFGSTPFYTII
jgi:hypothetical protein